MALDRYHVIKREKLVLESEVKSSKAEFGGHRMMGRLDGERVDRDGFARVSNRN